MILENMFDSPEKYDEAAVIANSASQEMVDRLDLMTLKPTVIIDLGCGPGILTQLLKDKFPSAHVFSIDNAVQMLSYTKKRNCSTVICADALHLPFMPGSVDVIVANFLLPWLSNTEEFLSSCLKLLKAGGLLMYTTLGEMSLTHYAHQLNLADMHNLGDLMLNLGFEEPVLDVNHFTLTYRSRDKLLAELKASGMVRNEDIPKNDSLHDINFEVIFAHAFKSASAETFATLKNGEACFPVSALRKFTQHES